MNWYQRWVERFAIWIAIRAEAYSILYHGQPIQRFEDLSPERKLDFTSPSDDPRRYACSMDCEACAVEAATEYESDDYPV